MESFLLTDLKKIKLALAVGDINAAKILLYIVITREEVAAQAAAQAAEPVCTCSTRPTTRTLQIDLGCPVHLLDQ